MTTKTILHVPSAEARASFTEVISRARYGDLRIVITNKGIQAAAIISMEDLQRLRAIESGDARLVYLDNPQPNPYGGPPIEPRHDYDVMTTINGQRRDAKDAWDEGYEAGLAAAAGGITLEQIHARLYTHQPSLTIYFCGDEPEEQWYIINNPAFDVDSGSQYKGGKLAQSAPYKMRVFASGATPQDAYAKLLARAGE